MSDELIAKILGVPVEQKDPEPVEDKSDQELARDELRRIVKITGEAIDELVEVAKASQNDKIYNALANLTKSVVDANKTLAKMNKNSGAGPNKVTNNLFVGSTADLQRVLKRTKEEQ